LFIMKPLATREGQAKGGGWKREETKATRNQTRQFERSARLKIMYKFVVRSKLLVKRFVVDKLVLCRFGSSLSA